jgi:hypothetical protein
MDSLVANAGVRITPLIQQPSGLINQAVKIRKKCPNTRFANVCFFKGRIVHFWIVFERQPKHNASEDERKYERKRAAGRVNQASLFDL